MKENNSKNVSSIDDFFKDFFMRNFGMCDDKFFEDLDELSQNEFSKMHTFYEKFEDGNLVKRDEEKFENGKKILDKHETFDSSNNNLIGNTCRKDCCDKQDEKCDCKKTIELKDNLINKLEMKVSNLESEVKTWKTEYYRVLQEKKDINDKLSSIKRLFS